MDKQTLEREIGRIRDLELRTCPGGLAPRVFCKIRKRREAEGGFWSWLDGILPRPGFAVPAFAAAIFTSLATVVFAMNVDLPERPKIAQVALGFDSIAQPHVLPFNP